MSNFPMTYEQAAQLVALIAYGPETCGDPEVWALVNDEIDRWPDWMVPIFHAAIRTYNEGRSKPRPAPPPLPRTLDEFRAHRLKPRR